jgi:LAO/AO transport system kinase
MQIPTLDQILQGDALTLGRAITLAERQDPAARGFLDKLQDRTGRAFRVGITGPPGVGKSSLLREVARRVREGGERLAIIAADPVSPASGGALLGDRFRLGPLAQDEGIFFRSIAHRGSSGEPCVATDLAASILDAGGFPWLFFETVGVGQADVHALRGSHLKILIHSPDSGDEIQMMKAGLVETVDLHVVNKCDRSGGRAWADQLAATLSVEDKEVRVFSVSATGGEGMDELVEELQKRRDGRVCGSGDPPQADVGGPRQTGTPGDGRRPEKTERTST